MTTPAKNGPSNRQLFIPGKTNKQAHPRYEPDMQTLEIWARQPIQQLIAGSGITLTPASGLATDSKGNGPNPITISSTGGGSGITVGYVNALWGPDTGGVTLDRQVFFGPGAQNFGPLANDNTSLVLPSNSTGSDQIVGFGSGWQVLAAASASVDVLPEFDFPTFTGGPVTAYLNISAANATFTTWLQAATTAGKAFTSGLSYQFVPGDFTIITHGGTDLGTTLVAGTGTSGNGIVSAAGGVYWAGVSGYFVIPTGTTF